MRIHERLSKQIKILLCIPPLLMLCNSVDAQSKLLKEISVNNVQSQHLGDLLNNIAQKENISFAYNNDIVPADSVITIPHFQGTLLSFLNKTLGSNYEFKELPGYIILRYAPKKFYITGEINNENSLFIRGYVYNLLDHKAVTQASVYEKNLLVSTLTDKNGYFELALKNWSGPLQLTASKENYHDTTLNFLQEVKVSGVAIKREYKFYPKEKYGFRLDYSRFARFFIGPKRWIQGLNIGDVFTSSGYQISVLPGLSSHGMYNSQVTDHFSLNILGGYTAGIQGFEMAGLFNINRKDMRYFQAAGVFNFVGGRTSGIQVAGIFNRVLNDASGFQAAGFANVDREIRGVQIAGFLNKYDIGSGVSLAGLGNFSLKKAQVQLAGIFNKGKDISVVQFAGFMNIAQKVKGTQIGLINIADSSDYAIGILNFIKNGQKSIAIGTDESGFIQSDFRSGGKILYGVLGIGFKPGSTYSKYLVDFGIGAHFFNESRFNTDAEYISSMVTKDFKKQLIQIASFKVLTGYKFNTRLRLFAGPSLNFSSADSPGQFKAGGWIISKDITNDKEKFVYIGITGGLQLVW